MTCDEPFLAMEYCDGGNLKTFLYQDKKCKITLQEMLGLLKDIVSAVEYLHRHNYVHCNIKLDNIFLTNKKRTAKLGGFRLARSLKSSSMKCEKNMSTQSDMFCGLYFPTIFTSICRTIQAFETI